MGSGSGLGRRVAPVRSSKPLPTTVPLLRDYRRQTGSWAETVSFYHGHNPALAETYTCRAARALHPDMALRNCAR